MSSTPRPEPSALETDFRTHWEGCWEHRGHHECAIARVRELEAARSPGGRERVIEILDEVMDDFYRAHVETPDSVADRILSAPSDARASTPEQPEDDR